jgi:hypothetical protein
MLKVLLQSKRTINGYNFFPFAFVVILSALSNWESWFVSCKVWDYLSS